VSEVISLTSTLRMMVQKERRRVIIKHLLGTAKRRTLKSQTQ
jgi:hypothetical protein